MNPSIGERDLGMDKSCWPKNTDLANSPEYSLPALPQPSHQGNIIQAQEETWAENTSGSLGSVPDFGLPQLLKEASQGTVSGS